MPMYTKRVYLDLHKFACTWNISSENKQDESAQWIKELILKVRFNSKIITCNKKQNSDGTNYIIDKQQYYMISYESHF